MSDFRAFRMRGAGETGGAGDPSKTNDTAEPASNTPTENGELFKDGVSGDDPVQGQISDCFLMGAMGAIADTNPQAIRDAIKDNGNGTYTVRFYNDDGDPEYVTVDGNLYRDASGNPIYGKSSDTGEIWPSIMEKAYAEWKGGSYESIDHGGKASDVMRAITGRDPDFHKTSSSSDEELWENLNTGRPTTAHTPDPGDGEDKKQADYNDNGLYTWHVYEVLGTQEENGQKYVVLRNPHGRTEFDSDDRYETEIDQNGDGTIDTANDGTFRMSLEDYKKYFSGTTVGG